MERLLERLGRDNTEAGWRASTREEEKEDRMSNAETRRETVPRCE